MTKINIGITGIPDFLNQNTKDAKKEKAKRKKIKDEEYYTESEYSSMDEEEQP